MQRRKFRSLLQEQDTLSSVTFVRFWIAIASSFRALTNTGLPFLKLTILTKSDLFFRPSEENFFLQYNSAVHRFQTYPYSLHRGTSISLCVCFAAPAPKAHKMPQIRQATDCVTNWSELKYPLLASRWVNSRIAWKQKCINQNIHKESRLSWCKVLQKIANFRLPQLSLKGQ